MAYTDDFILLAEEIYTQLTGADIKETESLLIRLKLNKLSSMTRENADADTVNEYKELIAYTAALMAALDLNEKERALYQKPVKIGDVTMVKPIGSEGLRALIKGNLSELSPILTDNTFIFKVMEAEE